MFKITGRYEDEHYAEFIRIEGGEHTILIFRHDESDDELAERIVALLNG